MPPPILVTESTLTERYQTTVPDTIRKALGLKKREKLRYTVQAKGDVVLSRAESHEEDPVMSCFLDFIALDIANNPSRISVVGESLANRIQSLVADVEIDLDSPLSEEDE